MSEQSIWVIIFLD